VSDTVIKKSKLITITLIAIISVAVMTSCKSKLTSLNQSSDETLHPAETRIASNPTVSPTVTKQPIVTLEPTTTPIVTSQTAPRSEPIKENTNGKNESKPLTDTKQVSDRLKLISSLAAEHIQLYGVEENYSYSNFKLKIKDRTINIDGITADSGGFGPKLETMELPNGNKIVLVFFTIGHGTGLYLDDIRIFNVQTFEEYHLEKPNSIVNEHINIVVKEEKADILIDELNSYTISLKDYENKLGLPKRVEPALDTFVSHFINDNELYAQIGLNDGSTNQYYRESIVIKYKLEDKNFILNKIEIKKQIGI
jgi:hypothetical protein